MSGGAKILELTVVHDRWSRFSDALFELPNGAIERRVIEDHGEAACVLPFDPARGTVLLVEQPRAPVLHATGSASMLEVVAGRIEVGRSAPETVRSEAREEAGVQLIEIEHIATLWSMPAVSTERLHLYLAVYSEGDRVAAGGGAEDENECIVVRELDLGSLWHMLERGELTDAKTFILVQALRLRRPDLFEDRRQASAIALQSQTRSE